jgi:hypothetical protein
MPIIIISSSSSSSSSSSVSSSIVKAYALESGGTEIQFSVRPGVRPLGRWAVAQAVSRRLSAAATRVRAQVSSCGICGEQSDTIAGFL